MNPNPTAWTPDPVGAGTTTERYEPERRNRIDGAVVNAAENLFPAVRKDIDADIRAEACEARRRLRSEYGYDVPRERLAKEIRSTLYEWASHGR